MCEVTEIRCNIERQLKQLQLLTGELHDSKVGDYPSFFLRGTETGVELEARTVVLEITL